MPNLDNEKRWRQALEHLGPNLVRLRLTDGRSSGPGSGADVMNIAGESPHPSRGFVEDWLKEKQRESEGQETTRFKIVLIATVVGTVDAIVAAVTGVIAVWPMLFGR